MWRETCSFRSGRDTVVSHLSCEYWCQFVEIVGICEFRADGSQLVFFFSKLTLNSCISLPCRLLLCTFVLSFCAIGRTKFVDLQKLLRMLQRTHSANFGHELDRVVNVRETVSRARSSLRCTLSPS